MCSQRTSTGQEVEKARIVYVLMMLAVLEVGIRGENKEPSFEMGKLRRVESFFLGRKSFSKTPNSESEEIGNGELKVPTHFGIQVPRRFANPKARPRKHERMSKIMRLVYIRQSSDIRLYGSTIISFENKDRK